MSAEVPFVDLVAQHRALRKELIEVFSSALDRAAFVGGPMVEAFEADFGRFGGFRHVVAMSNGTDALRIALQAMGVGAGARVVTVPNTFIATTEAISQAGGTFEFVDIDPATCLMDPNRLEDHLKDAFGRRPKAERPACVVPVHLYGQVCDMDAIQSLAQRYQLKVLEDAAQAHGAAHRGRAAGTLGDAAAFSFYPGKNLGACGEAGAVVTGDASVAERARMLRDHGQSERYRHRLEGTNSRIDAIQAGFLRVKLRHLAAWNEARREIGARYDAAFFGIEGVRAVDVLPHCKPSRHLYVIHAERRDALRAFLRERGIQSGLHYPLPLHLQECYRGLGIGAGAFPHAEWSAARVLSLPIFPEMTHTQAQAVIRGVEQFATAC
ncbi:MAG TPA: DegT/DnrJ/EryC1/StrS family aminotransferase [Burkholderiales bacterium]|nr:DegT/DnrJ/EryC1/StrS family aminotransferase [Burkholderiales bacterium]